MTPAPHPLRCETCDPKYLGLHCPVYHLAFMSKEMTETIMDITSRIGCASHSASSDKVLDDYNDELLTKLVQELAGTWRMRDGKLFEIIRSYRRKPIGAMKDRQQTKEHP
jgi:hypothetical protein